MRKSDFDLSQQAHSTESKIVASLERIAQAFRVLLWQESKEHGLSPIQVQALIFIRYHSEEKRKVSYLANEFNMTKATISDTIKALEQKELISKEYESHDSRSYIIHLTAKGKEIVNRTAGFTNDVRRPIENLPDADKESMLNSLLNIISHLNQTGVITIQRMCSTCTHYQNNTDGTHYCNLLNQTLLNNDLRIDCPEHEIITK